MLLEAIAMMKQLGIYNVVVASVTIVIVITVYRTIFDRG